jgi:CHAD domain-containing protein
MEKLLLDYCLQQHSNISHYLNLCVERAEAESVHQLRVSIKKFRAVSMLLEYLLPETSRENREQLDKLRRLFKLAGQLRESQIHLILFNYYKTELNIEAAGFELHLKKNEKSALRKFITGFGSFDKIVTEKSFNHKNFRKLELIPNESFRPAASAFLEKKIRKLKKLVIIANNEKLLHDARIQLKQIRYLLSILTLQDDFFRKYELAMVQLRATEILLGRWHDLAVFREVIGKFAKQKKKSDCLQEIFTLNAAVTIDIEIYKEQIISSFRQNFQNRLP